MDKCTDGMDKCRKCIALGLPSPTDYGMGGWCKALLKPAVKARDDCHLTTSDMEAIKAAIAGGGRLVILHRNEQIVSKSMVNTWKKIADTFAEHQRAAKPRR